MRRFQPLLALALVASLVCACGSDDEGVDETGGDAAVDAGVAAATDASAANEGGPGVDASLDAGVRDGANDAAPAVVYSGEATYYAADGTGACGFAASPGNLMVAAMNKSQYKKALCGQCVHVKGPKGEVTVRIVDLCPGCSMGDLDLSEEAFAAISPLSAGRVKIAWSFAPCP